LGRRPGVPLHDPLARLTDAVRQGRRRKFAEHGWSADRIPDPQDHSTVLGCVLDWTEPNRHPHAELLDWYRQLIRLRRTHPELTDPDLSAVRVAYDEEERWLVVRRGPYRVMVHLGEDGPRPVPLDAPYTGTLALFGDCWPAGDGSLFLAADSTAVVRVG